MGSSCSTTKDDSSGSRSEEGTPVKTAEGEGDKQGKVDPGTRVEPMQTLEDDAVRSNNREAEVRTTSAAATSTTTTITANESLSTAPPQTASSSGGPAGSGQPPGTARSDANHLPSFSNLPEVSRNLIEGKPLQSSYYGLPNTIVVVTIAHPTDALFELAHFRQEILPQLRSIMGGRNMDLHLIDFHLGTEDRWLSDGDFLRSFLEEIKDHYPFCIIPVIFLNEKIGDVEPPFEIPKDVYEAILPKLKAEEKARLGKLYILETSSYLLNSKSRPYQGSEETYSKWKEEIQSICRILSAAMFDHQRDSYLTSFLEKELRHVLLKIPEARKNAIWVRRKPSRKPEDQRYVAETEDEERRVKRTADQLKEHLSANHIVTINLQWTEDVFFKASESINEYSKELTKCLLEPLTGIISVISDHSNNQVLTLVKDFRSLTLLNELYRHEQYSHAFKNYWVSPDALEAARQYLTGDCNSVYIIHGASGSGKSSLVAKIGKQIHQWLPNVVIVTRYLGCLSRTATLEDVLRSVAEHCSFLYGEHNSLAYQDLEGLTSVFPKLWSKACEDRHLVIIVDEVDSIRNFSASWLPKELPKYVKIILTANSSSPVMDIVKNHSEFNGINAMPRLHENDIGKIIAVTKLLSHKVRGDNVGTAAKYINQCPLPLLLQVFLWLMDNERNDKVENLASDILSNIELVFDVLEDLYGKVEVAFILGSLAASRFGISIPELSDLLSHKEDVGASWTLPSERVHVYSMARIRLILYRLRPFIVQTSSCGIPVYKYATFSFLDVARTRYLENSLVYKEMLQYYQGISSHSLAVYKHSSIVQQSNPSDHISKRQLVEEPWIAHHSHSDVATMYLTNWEWVSLKLAKAGPYAFYVRLQGCDDLVNKECHPFLSHVYEQVSSSASLKSLRACLKIPGGPKDESLDPIDNENVILSSVYRIPENPDHVVTLSFERGELTVWDLITMSPVRTLKGICQPRRLEMIDCYKCLVLCGRELRTYDLDSGSFLLKLRELMNQQMPFFGLHDKDHVVSLSRSRMYVNMMNLTNGQCVTTFKVGEDRFLNSLSVSENGKICVCGDNSQTPSSLLVWDLVMRKLLYDLRIPYHEFLTNFLTITKEGHYVSCVCKEVDDTSPNFIVVYDLQSGTLFKKWKPGVNIVSCSISSAGGCVVAGLQNCNLMAFDLVTGNPRWNVRSHLSPPDSIKLDGTGQRVLTYDSSGMDKSLMIWDINTGNKLAVFTPDCQLIAAELSNEGNAIVMLLKNSGQIATCCLSGRENEEDKPREAKTYGNENNIGRVFDLISD